MKGTTLTNSILLTYLRLTLLTLATISLTACVSTSKQVDTASYGPFPENHQEIVKAYLKNDSSQADQIFDLEKTNFLNTPDKYTYTQFGRQKEYGYRVCALLKSKDGKNIKSHFFLINNNKVTNHLMDLGLVKLSDDYCNTEMLIASKGDTNTDNVATEQTVAPKNDVKYIVCRVDGGSKFFSMNPTQKQLQEQDDGRVIKNLSIEQLSETFIVAVGDNNTRISLNRISGNMIYRQGEIESAGNCELTRKRKF